MIVHNLTKESQMFPPINSITNVMNCVEQMSDVCTDRNGLIIIDYELDSFSGCKAPHQYICKTNSIVQLFMFATTF